MASTAAQRGRRQRAQEAIECGRKGEVALDRVTAELFMFNVDRRWPETDGEKTEYCRYIYLETKLLLIISKLFKLDQIENANDLFATMQKLVSKDLASKFCR